MIEHIPPSPGIMYRAALEHNCLLAEGGGSSACRGNSKVPEGHHPRGTTLREALRGNLPLRGLCGGLSEGSAGSLRGFCGVSAGFCGGPRDFPRVSGVVTLCL